METLYEVRPFFMLMKISFQAQLWKRQEDHEGELTVIFKVPLSEAAEVKQMPVQTILDIKVSFGE